MPADTANPPGNRLCRDVEQRECDLTNLEACLRIILRTVPLAILVIALLAIGGWCCHQRMIKEIDAAFAVGWFSPIRWEYTHGRSCVILTPEQAAEMERREHELQLRLETEAGNYRALSILSFCATIVPLFGLVILGRAALKERQPADDPPADRKIES
jgi:hypothetical protein